MESATRQLMAHPYVVLFGTVLLEQIGLPVPAGLFLVAAGALASAGFVNLGILATAALVVGPLRLCQKS